MELYATSAPGAFREEDALVFQERLDARDLPAFVLTRLQPALLRKQHKVSHYLNLNRAKQRGRACRWRGAYIGAQGIEAVVEAS